MPMQPFRQRQRSLQPSSSPSQQEYQQKDPHQSHHSRPSQPQLYQQSHNVCNNDKMAPRSFKHRNQQKTQPQSVSASASNVIYDPPSGVDPPMLKPSSVVRRTNPSKLPPPPPLETHAPQTTQIQPPSFMAPSVASSMPRNSSRTHVSHQPSHISCDPPSAASVCQLKKASSKSKSANNIISDVVLRDDLVMMGNNNRIISNNIANNSLNRQSSRQSSGQLQRYASPSPMPPPQVMPSVPHSPLRHAGSPQRQNPMLPVSTTPIRDGRATNLRRRAPGDNSHSGDSTISTRTASTLWSTSGGPTNGNGTNFGSSSGRGSAYYDNGMEEGTALSMMEEENQDDMESIGTATYYEYYFGGYPKNGSRRSNHRENGNGQYFTSNTSQRRHSSRPSNRKHSKSKSKQFDYTNSSNQMAKVITLAIIILVTCWVSLLGVELSISIAKGALHFVLGFVWRVTGNSRHSHHAHQGIIPRRHDAVDDPGSVVMRDFKPQDIEVVDYPSSRDNDGFAMDGKQKHRTKTNKAESSNAKLRGNNQNSHYFSPSSSNRYKTNFQNPSNYDAHEKHDESKNYAREERYTHSQGLGKNAKEEKIVSGGDFDKTETDEEEFGTLQESDELYQLYMGKDATYDFFFAGKYPEKLTPLSLESPQDERNQTVSIPVHAYATLPFSVDSNPFVVSVWINLAPEFNSNRGKGKPDVAGDDRNPRVIFSTRLKDSTNGCTSALFGGPATGMVLYAQPTHVDHGNEIRTKGKINKDNSNTGPSRNDGGDERSYRIVLEYSTSASSQCHALVGASSHAQVVKEGEWHHIVVLVSRPSTDQITADTGDERISIYVDGDIAGRDEYVSDRLATPRRSSMQTLVGRHALQEKDASNPNPKLTMNAKNAFDLGGRIGMFSYWEIGGPITLAHKDERMTVQSITDEDHVVRAVNRAAFDVRALKELPLQGLDVMEPTLLYTFDGQKDKGKKGTSLEESSRVRELVYGKDGTIMKVMPQSNQPPRPKEEPKVKPAEKTHEPLPSAKEVSSATNGDPTNDNQNVSQSKQKNPKDKPSSDITPAKLPPKKPFVPLGGNRYNEYRNGAYIPPAWKESELKELARVALARKGRVKMAMEHAWNGYRTFAWGSDELLPLTNVGQDNWGGMGTTLVDSLSTLWLLGMKDEFWEARDWVKDNLDFSKIGTVSVFETTIRNLGGLLSAYDLSQDTVFLEKANDLGKRLMKAFGTPNGVPYGETELFDEGQSYNTGWHSNSAVLSEIGSLQMEFRYLARVTGKSEYATIAMRALDELLKLQTDSGLFPTFIHNTKQSLSFGNSAISVGAMGDSFYEYLLKIWLQVSSSTFFAFYARTKCVFIHRSHFTLFNL
ncbi:hypothetical protein ACHAXS_010462 [Conticribra weissflogii]